METRISPFQLPHPAERRQRTYRFINKIEDVAMIDNDWPKIYTDGSKIENKVGFAVTVWLSDKEIKRITSRLESYCSVYQAELIAILKAVQFVSKSDKYPKANILSDSRSAIESICNPSSLHPIVAEIQNNIFKLENNSGSIELFWIKAHCGIPGNERADDLAKNAAINNKQRPIYDKFPLSYAKHLTRNATLMIWQQKYFESTGSETIKMFFPNVQTAYKILRGIKITNLETQLFTGHGGNKSYLHRFKLSTDPHCTCDHESDQTIEHIITQCPKFNKIRYECECSVDMSINKDTVSKMMEDDNRRSRFMQFALSAIRVINKENGSKL